MRRDATARAPAPSFDEIRSQLVDGRWEISHQPDTQDQAHPSSAAQDLPTPA